MQTINKQIIFDIGDILVCHRPNSILIERRFPNFLILSLINEHNEQECCLNYHDAQVFGKISICEEKFKIYKDEINVIFVSHKNSWLTFKVKEII